MKLNKLVSTLNMEHEEWLENRRKGIGGSDAGSICGLNPYSSAIAVFQDKTQPLTEKPDNESMRQGRDLEEYVARRFMEETGKKVRRHIWSVMNIHAGKLEKGMKTRMVAV